MYCRFICLALVVYTVTAGTVTNITENVSKLPETQTNPATNLVPNSARQQRQFLISPPTFRKRQPAKKTKVASNPPQRRAAYNMPQPGRGQNAPQVVLGGFRVDNFRRKVPVKTNLARRQFPAPGNLQGYYVNVQPYRTLGGSAGVKSTKAKSNTRKASTRPRRRFMPAGLMS